MQAGQIIDGRFEIEALAGAGGMGAVYRAVDRASGRPVAVKVLVDPDFGDAGRFEREARILGALDHPHIVRYVGHGSSADRRPYLVLEWLSGHDLAERLAAGALDVRSVVRLGRIALRALAAAHAQGVVHRDVKPSNVFLVEGRIELAKIIDFGIARASLATRVATLTGATLGTPAYMAPEQARGERDVDARADIFSLGCVLYECVTGQAPFAGSNVMAILAKVLFEEPPRASELCPHVPPALDALIARMLRKSPAERPRDAAAVARALDDIVVPAGEELPAPAEPRRPTEITRREQRLLAVVLSAPASPSVAPEDATIEATVHAGAALRLAEIAASFGAQFSPLAEGGSAAVLTAAGVAGDLAVRAARCALALRKARPGAPIAIAIGRGEASARAPTGEVIDRAATLVRRRELAGAALIRIDDVTAGLLGERFELGGNDEGLWLVGEHELPERIRPLLGKSSPFVGRKRELALVEGALAECFDESVARGVTITGEPGSGKSRLRREVARLVEKRGLECEVWLGRGDPIAIGAPFGIASALLSRLAGLTEGEPHAVRQRKLRARTTRCLDEERAARATELFCEIVGSPVESPSVPLRAARADATLMGDQLARAFEDLVEAEALARPVLVVLEDLQWGDAASLRLVESAMRRCKDLPLFVLALARPEAAPMIAALCGLAGTTQLSLGPLSRRAAQELVRSALGDQDSRRLDEIVARGAGNPFHIEELVRHAASGSHHSLPPTVLAMLHARIDALAPEPRRILRAASVFGKVFWSGAIAQLLGDGNRTASELRDWMPVLVAEELVERRPSSRFLGEEEYELRHALLRDAAYATFTDEDRATGHRLAAAWLEQMGEHNALVLGEHFERGGEHGRASQCLLRAAHEALEGHDVSGALSFVQRARATLERDPGAAEALRGDVALSEAEVRRWRGEFEAAERCAMEALELLPRGRATWFRAATEAINAAGRRGAYELAIEWGSSMPAAEGPQACTARALALCTAGRQLFHAGGYELADELIETLKRDLGGAIDDPLSMAELHRLLGARARHVGDLGGDLEHYALALDAYERAGDARNAANARVSVGFAHIEVGDHAEARVQLSSARAEAERMGLSTVTTRANQNLGLLLLLEGHPLPACEILVEVVAESREHGNVRFEGWSRVYLAHARLAAGDLAAARAEAEAAAALLELTPPARAGALALLALACIAAGEHDEAELHARGALAVLDAFGGIEEFESLVWLAAVRAAMARGDSDVACERIARAIERLEARASAIPDPCVRASFLERVPENAALRGLAQQLSRVPIAPPAALVALYSPEAFTADAELLVDKVREHLASAIAGGGRVTEGFVSPEQMLARFATPFPEEPVAGLDALTSAILESSVRQHHPRCTGYQVSAPLPRAALATMLASILNSGMAAFDSGPAPTVMERRVIDWMLDLVGWRAGGGILTSGGSLGNLTALLAARAAAPQTGSRRLAVLASEQAHYSVERAAGIMGLGDDAVVGLRHDAAYRIDPSSIAPAIDEARARGLTPFALVASAGSTGTGAIDPLEAIADACDEAGLWLHVDGAHGASALVSPKHRGALRGIERARSVVWDAHKLMAMPALCTAVLFRDRADGYATFAQRAAYLYDDADAEPWYDIGKRTVECTKPLLSIPLYVCLSTLGTRAFASIVDHAYALAARFASMLEEAPDFELACRPDSNILCFRHLPADPVIDASAHQRRIRALLREEGSFFLVSTVLGGETWLRTSLMSPMSTERDLVALLDAIRSAPQAP